MAELRCPKCGKSNPDLLDVCQYCQTPLKKDTALRAGQTPTKKNTGELEASLPDWLKDVRQQARNSTEEDAIQEIPQPKIEKEEPPDLLAGLASQASDSNEDELPDWLANLSPAGGLKSAAPTGTTPSTPAPESDFFAQFRNESAPASKPPQAEPPAAPVQAADKSPAPAEEDDLSKWFAQASTQPEEVVRVNPEAQDQSDEAWSNRFDSSSPAQQEPPPKEEEDLSWLHNLEAAAKQTGDLHAPKPDTDWTADFELPATPSQPSASQEDLSWLDNLGGIEGPQPAPGQPAAAGEDLSWLNNLSAVTEDRSPKAAPEKPASAHPFVSEEDLGWLSTLGETSESAQPAQAAPGSSSSPQEDLSWLNNLGGTSEPAQPASAAPESLSSPQDDLSWLNKLGGEAEQPFTPPFAESTTQDVGLDKQEEAEPDWLKSALETPSMPPAGAAPGDVSMDWFTRDQPEEQKASPAVTPPASSVPQSSPFADAFAAPGEPSSLSSQDVDSLFSAEMPDWLSRSEPAKNEPGSQEGAPSLAAGDESLAPVDLPSWVQAMRPVEAVISETAASGEEEPEEKEGPLAGLRGVIPGVPVGSSVKPKSISLKLQATKEQQASAALLEQILGSETNPRALILSALIASQRWLRVGLAVLFWVILGLIIGLRSNMMPVPAFSTEDSSSIVGALMSVPANAKVLVVIDYEPSLAGEMEAVGGPLLNHMVQLGHPTLSFISTSPNGVALVERLMINTNIAGPTNLTDPTNPAPGGFGYQSGVQYCNLGFLPGGSAGALGFIKSPNLILPSTCEEVTTAGSFSEYAAVVLMTDRAESGQVWVEQLYAQRQNKPLLVVASAQAGPLLQPYVSSRQITAMVSGLSDAARYEQYEKENALSTPGMASSYWDAFGIGMAMAVALILVGSLWSLFAGIRARRAESEQG